MPGPISIYEHQAHIFAGLPRRDPRFAELDQLIASGPNRRKKIPGKCRFCGDSFESTKAVKGHEKACRTGRIPLWWLEPYRQNGIRQREAHRKAWETRRKLLEVRS